MKFDEYLHAKFCKKLVACTNRWITSSTRFSGSVPHRAEKCFECEGPRGPIFFTSLSFDSWRVHRGQPGEIGGSSWRCALPLVN